MKKRRVVITGVGVMTPIGHNYDEFKESLFACRSGVTAMNEWIELSGIATRVAAPVQNFDGSTIPRQQRRSMSRMSQFATFATQEAISRSDLPESQIQNTTTGVAYGSLMGGLTSLEQYFKSIIEHNSYVAGVQSTLFLQMMSHSVAANVAMAFGIPGRMVSSCVACSASTQSIGFGYEWIRDGLIERMICGGAEELHLGVVGCFDVLRATSRKWNDQPAKASRPFDQDRDGIACGEGAGTLILEELEQAKSRGAKIFGEILGFATGTDTSHMTNPSRDAMELVMRAALENAEIDPSDVAYVNAHATGTDVGDIAESHAIQKIFGGDVPVSSMKGHFGHLMGACGVVETAACLAMMEKGVVVPTLNLESVDKRCAENFYVMQNNLCNLREGPIVKNSFAFGGINVSLVISPFFENGRD